MFTTGDDKVTYKVRSWHLRVRFQNMWVFFYLGGMIYCLEDRFCHAENEIRKTRIKRVILQR